jgi:hypothetical protein
MVKEGITGIGALKQVSKKVEENLFAFIRKSLR